MQIRNNAIYALRNINAKHYCMRRGGERQEGIVRC